MSIDPRQYADDYPGNCDRAEWAEHALTVFCEETGLDQESERDDAVSDLMCNLGHYCDQYGLDFLALASRAIALWDVEKREEENGEANALYSEKKVYILLDFPN
jgi:hypothetical protein